MPTKFHPMPKALPLRPSVFSYRSKGICKQGERSDLTGCTPASGEATGQPSAEQEQPKKEKRVPEQTPSTHVERAKKAHVLVSADIQRYAEEHNEPQFAKSLGGVSFPDSESIDIAIPGPSGAVAHGVELKTSVIGKNRQIDMNAYAKVRKIIWEQQQHATYHTIVLDDHDVYNANGEGQHDESKRRIFYRRGVGGSKFSIDGMHECKDIEELKQMMEMDEKKLPKPAQRTDQKLRVGKWKPIVQDGRKGFKNSKTGEIVLAKK